MCMYVEAWAAGEAALMRTVAVHGLTLARRAAGSKSPGLTVVRLARYVPMVV